MSMSPDLIFPPGDTFAFIVDTNSYSGNFEREMISAIIGINERGFGHKQVEQFNELWQSTHAALIGDLRRNIRNISRHHSDSVAGYICQRPGRVNNGSGQNFNVDEYLGIAYPAYESVAVFFRRLPSDDEINFMKMNLDIISWEQSGEEMIVGFRMQCIHVDQTITDIDILK